MNEQNYGSRIVLLGAKKVGHQTSVSFEKFDVVQALLSCCLSLLSWKFDTILADILKIYFILIFYFSKCPLLLNSIFTTKLYILMKKINYKQR
jgi:hypothetical protein